MMFDVAMRDVIRQVYVLGEYDLFLCLSSNYLGMNGGYCYENKINVDAVGFGRNVFFSGEGKGKELEDCL